MRVECTGEVVSRTVRHADNVSVMRVRNHGKKFVTWNEIKDFMDAARDIVEREDKSEAAK